MLESLSEGAHVSNLKDLTLYSFLLSNAVFFAVAVISHCYLSLDVHHIVHVERNPSKIFDYQGTGKDSAPRSRRQKVSSENGSRHRANKQEQTER